MNDAAQGNQYKYNGKELNSDFGLNWMDYGARWYDASVGRWWGVDLLTGRYLAWSPYNYAVGNPIKFIDPNGMFVSWNPGVNEMIDDSKRDVDTWLKKAKVEKEELPIVWFVNDAGLRNVS